jgi:hypothetical protein
VMMLGRFSACPPVAADAIFPPDMVWSNFMEAGDARGATRRLRRAGEVGIYSVAESHVRRIAGGAETGARADFPAVVETGRGGFHGTGAGYTEAQRRSWQTRRATGCKRGGT